MTNPFRSGGALIGRFYLRYLSLCITRSGKRWTSLLAVLIIVIIYYYFATDFFFFGEEMNGYCVLMAGWVTTSKWISIPLNMSCQILPN